MLSLAYFSLIVLLVLTLVKAADYIEDAFILISKRLQIAEFFIGFFILGAITSLPEFAIAISSHDVAPEISIGNLFGASLVIFTFLIGLSVVKFGDLELKGKFKEKDLIISLLIFGSALASIMDRHLDIYEGVFLLCFVIIYLISLGSGYKRTFTKTASTKIESEVVFKIFVKAAIGVILLLVSSNLIMDAIIAFTEVTPFIGKTFIGVVFLSLGTNSPELAMLFKARSKGERAEKLAVGNFIGSAIVNMIILGLLSLMSQGVVINDFENLIPLIIILAIVLVVFSIFAWTGQKISKIEGYFLIGLYFVFLSTQVFILAIN